MQPTSGKELQSLQVNQEIETSLPVIIIYTLNWPFACAKD